MMPMNGMGTSVGMQAQDSSSGYTSEAPYWSQLTDTDTLAKLLFSWEWKVSLNPSDKALEEWVFLDLDYPLPLGSLSGHEPSFWPQNNHRELNLPVPSY